MKRAEGKLKAADNPPKDSRLLNIMIKDLYTEGEKLNEMFMSRDHNLIQNAKDFGVDTTTINNLKEALCNLILKIDSKSLILHKHKDKNPTNIGGADRVFNNTKEIGESNESQAKYQVQKIDGNSEHNASESSCPWLRGLPVHGSHLVLDHSNPTVIPTLRNEVNPMNDLLSVFETKIEQNY